MDLTLDLGITLLKWVAAPTVSILVTLLFSEPIKNWIAPLLSRLGTKSDNSVRGVWIAQFQYGNTSYTEVIEIISFLGIFVGKIIPDPRNNNTLRQIENSRPVRLRGSVKDHRFFTGIWFHPLRSSHFHGAFDLIVHLDGEHMSGIWIGYSETKNVIEAGEWTWAKVSTTDSAFTLETKVIK